MNPLWNSTKQMTSSQTWLEMEYLILILKSTSTQKHLASNFVPWTSTYWMPFCSLRLYYANNNYFPIWWLCGYWRQQPRPWVPSELFLSTLNMPSTFHCSLHDPFQVLSSPSHVLFWTQLSPIPFRIWYPQTSDVWNDLSSSKRERGCCCRNSSITKLSNTML